MIALEQRPVVSVIIPFYNVEKYIGRCARSLFDQTLAEMEFIFVDDCGSDGSAELLANVVAERPERCVRIVKMPENQGVSAARAAGIALATGEYLGFCDSDDWVEPTMYERLYGAAIGQKADIVGCGFVEHWPDHDEEKRFDVVADGEAVICSFRHFGGVYGALCNKIIRREFFLAENLHLGDGLSMWEDSLTLIPMRLRSARTVFVRDCLYHYNVNEGSVTTRFSLRKVQDSCEALRRLERFFVANGYASAAEEMITCLKINAKEVLLRYPTRENIALWRETFPEATAGIWRYPSWNVVLKLRAWLVARMPLAIALIIIKYMRK